EQRTGPRLLMTKPTEAGPIRREERIVIRRRKKRTRASSELPAPNGAPQPAPGHCTPADRIRHAAAEVFGTFALTFVAAGGEVVAAWSKGEVSPAAKVVAPGLLVLAMIYAVGEASGAHFNPAVTFAFCLRRDFPWRSAPL